MREERGAVMTTKTCAWCKEEFTPQKPTSTCCCKRCAALYREAKKGRK